MQPRNEPCLCFSYIHVFFSPAASTSRHQVPFDNWIEKWEGGAKADKMFGRYKSLIKDKYASNIYTKNKEGCTIIKAYFEYLSFFLNSN